MNSRKRNFPRSNSINQIKEEITSSNISIDEDSIQYESPLSPIKQNPGSYLSSKNSKLIHGQNRNMAFNSQQKPKLKFSGTLTL